jgi:hypothetical protein
LRYVYDAKHKRQVTEGTSLAQKERWEFAVGTLQNAFTTTGSRATSRCKFGVKVTIGKITGDKDSSRSKEKSKEIGEGTFHNKPIILGREGYPQLKRDGNLRVSYLVVPPRIRKQRECLLPILPKSSFAIKENGKKGEPYRHCYRLNRVQQLAEPYSLADN